jgi:hypothetical protein
MAHTLPSEGACSTWAGTAFQPGNLEWRKAELTDICQLKDFELPDLTPLQRVQLSEIARKTLDEEISLLRYVLRRFKKAVYSDADDAIIKRLADILDLLGLTASRTASVLRADNSLNAGTEEDSKVKEILSQLQSALLEEDSQKEGN